MTDTNPLAPIEALHRPIRVYDECEHDEDHGCEPVYVYDYIGCSESVIGWACAACCYDDEYPREDCPHGATHSGIERANSCPTHTALAEARQAVDALARWKSGALPVLDGLQEIGKALGLPLGEQITGPAALTAIEALVAERDAAREALAVYIASQVGTATPTPLPADMCEPEPDDRALAEAWLAALTQPATDEEAGQ